MVCSNGKESKTEGRREHRSKVKITATCWKGFRFRPANLRGRKSAADLDPREDKAAAVLGGVGGGFGYQHLPEWVCEEVTENQLQ